MDEYERGYIEAIEDVIEYLEENPKISVKQLIRDLESKIGIENIE